MIIFSGTGRSGTLLYAKLFSAHHEYKVPDLIRKYWPPADKPVSTGLFPDLSARINIMEDHLSGVDIRSFRDSSNPYLYFLDALYLIDKRIKIVWGLRDGRDFAVSAITRQYHDINKYGYEMTPSRDDPFFARWSSLSPLEKMAWLWMERNGIGLKRLESVPEDNKLTIRLEDLTSPDEAISTYWIERLEDFLHAKAERHWLKVKVNRNAKSNFPDKSLWTPDMLESFNNIAGELMARFGYCQGKANEENIEVGSLPKIITRTNGKQHRPLVSIGMPAYNGGTFIQETLESLSAQTFDDFEVVISDDASNDRTGEICRAFALRDRRFRYCQNEQNIGAIRNYRKAFELSTGQYFMWTDDHDLLKPETLETYLKEFSNAKDSVLVYSPTVTINERGDIVRAAAPDNPSQEFRFASFLNVITGRVSSTAFCGLMKAKSLMDTSYYNSMGCDTIFLAELSLKGRFVQLPDSYYFRRQNRPKETPAQQLNRYVNTLHDDATKLMKTMPYEYMLYKYFCMVQNNNLLRNEQGVLNTYILDTFTRLWGIKPAAIIEVISDINQNQELALGSERSNCIPTARRFKDGRQILDVTEFAESLKHSAFSGLAEELLGSIHRPKSPSRKNGPSKRFASDKQYDVCYILYDTSKWGGVKGTLIQANELVKRGYRVCLVSPTPRPDWFELNSEFIQSTQLHINDIPASDFIIGTWYPTVATAFLSKNGIPVHYCRGYEGHFDGVTDEQRKQIEKIYALNTVKFVNSRHVAEFIKGRFGQQSYVVRNDVDHSIFFPRNGTKAREDRATLKILIVGPFSIAAKGVKECLYACALLQKECNLDIEVIRASQLPLSPEESQLVSALGLRFAYHCNLGEQEMAGLYNACDILLSGSYPKGDSFGRPVMEALACGLPTVVTDIPAYRDYDDIHDYSLFIKPGDSNAMADAARKIIEDDDLRKRLIHRGIEVSQKYSVAQTIDDLELALQDSYKAHAPVNTNAKTDRHYYGFSRPEVQALVRPGAKAILDVGCASGMLGADLKERLGAEVWGVEVVDTIAREAAQKLDHVINDDIEHAVPLLPDRYFDTIIFADVLEHLPDPFAVLEHVKVKLRDEGEVIASIPNVRHWSVLRGLLEGRWDYQDAGILDRTHLRFFTKHSVISLFDNAGFQIKELKATMLQGAEVPQDVLGALSQTQLDVSTLKEEAKHYQYLVRAAAKKKRSEIVSIVILTFNQLQYTKRCVKSIRKHTPEPHEIIFVDNGSTDGSVKWLRKLVKENANYTLIENSTNLGFAKGCNQGIEASCGEYIMLLNNDVIVTDKWLSGMLECLNSGPDTGVVGPMTNTISGPQQIRDDTYRSIEYLDTYARKFRETYRHRRIPLRRIVGFCMLFRRELVDRIGMLDESFGTGNFEDDDFCLRAALEGYRNLVAGDVFIHHFGSVSFAGNRIDYGSAMSGNRKILEDKWALNARSPLGNRLSVLVTTELADDNYQKGQIDRAIGRLIDGIKIAPDAKGIYYTLARMFIESKRFTEALEVLESMPESAKEELTGLESAGYSKEGLGLDDEADNYADRILSLDDKYPAALNLKGVLAYKKGNRTTAEDFFKRALDADPGYGEAHTNLGVLKWTAEERSEALDFLARGFILSPTIPDHSTLYYSALSSLGKFADAEAIFRDAKGLYPNNKNIAFLYIDTLIQQEKFSSAVTEIEDAIVSFGIDDNILNAALSVREKVGPRTLNEQGSTKATLSLCMIVKDEEEHLAKCLKSVRQVADETIVVDTGSTDRTREVARVFGAQVFELPWTGDFSTARNHSLSKANGDWILILDADEVLSPLDFKALMDIVGKRPQSPVAYTIVTRNYLTDPRAMGWMPNNGQYPEEAGIGWIPSPKVRLFTRDPRIVFSDPVHETLEASLESAGIPVKPCELVVHHFGKLVRKREVEKGKHYYELGKQKLEQDPNNLKFIWEFATQAQQLEHYEEASELWQKAVDLTPEHPVASFYFNLGYCFMMLKQYGNAIEYSKKALELDPSIKEAALNYANCEIIAGSSDQALDLLNGILEKVPDYPPAVLLVAVVFCIQGKVQEMQHCFGKLLSKGFKIAKALNALASQMVNQEKVVEVSALLNAMNQNGIGDQETLALLENLAQQG